MSLDHNKLLIAIPLDKTKDATEDTHMEPSNTSLALEDKRPKPLTHTLLKMELANSMLLLLRIPSLTGLTLHNLPTRRPCNNTSIPHLPSPYASMVPMSGKIITVESSPHPLDVEPLLTTLFKSLDGKYRTTPTCGTSGTPGEPTGENKVTSGCKSEVTSAELLTWLPLPLSK